MSLCFGLLRDQLGITGPKYGCGIDVCKGLHVPSRPGKRAVSPCSVKVSDMPGHEITTIEGISNGEDLHPVQEAWLDLESPMRVLPTWTDHGDDRPALEEVHPTDADIDAIENVCRCWHLSAHPQGRQGGATGWAVRDRVIGSSAPATEFVERPDPVPSRPVGEPRFFVDDGSAPSCPAALRLMHLDEKLHDVPVASWILSARVDCSTMATWILRTNPSTRSAASSSVAASRGD